MNTNNFKKNWLNSLSFLDNCIVNWTIVIILVLYCSTIFDNINNFIGNLYNLSIIKIIVLLLIVYVAPKDTTIAVLLALTYIISIFYMANSENFYSSSNEKKNVDNKGSMGSMGLMESMGSKGSMGSMESMESNSMKKNPNKMMNYDNNQNIESFSSKSKEHFFPLQKVDYTEESIVNTKQNLNLNQNVNQNMLNDMTCLQTYVPVNEQIGDVCIPTSTFKNEFNAQGLNYPEGFNHNVNGSPLDV